MSEASAGQRSLRTTAWVLSAIWTAFALVLRLRPEAQPEKWPPIAWSVTLAACWALGIVLIHLVAHTAAKRGRKSEGGSTDESQGVYRKLTTRSRPPMRWKVSGSSVRGFSHIRNGLPNQDALKWHPESGQGMPIVLALADGHGSAARAEDGARLAVDTAVQIFEEYLAELPKPLHEIQGGLTEKGAKLEPGELTAWKRAAEENLPKMIERRWKKAVESHLQEKPLTPEETHTAVDNEGERAKQKLVAEPIRAYGTTLVSLLIADPLVICAQIGDGELLVVMENGTVSCPMPDNPLNMGNETASLCMPEAWRQIQIHFQLITDALPTMFFLSTDGYRNAHGSGPASEEAFRRTAREFAHALQNGDPAEVFTELPETLNYASANGSGDDITVGLLWRPDAPKLPPMEPSPSVAVQNGQGAATATADVGEAPLASATKAPADKQEPPL